MCYSQYMILPFLETRKSTPLVLNVEGGIPASIVVSNTLLPGLARTFCYIASSETCFNVKILAYLRHNTILV